VETQRHSFLVPFLSEAASLFFESAPLRRNRKSPLVPRRAGPARILSGLTVGIGVIAERLFTTLIALTDTAPPDEIVEIHRGYTMIAA
jgi:hypothetical protein